MKHGAKKNIAVIGATGYTGQELLRILAKHPGADTTVVMTARPDTTPEPPALPVDTPVDRLDLGRLDSGRGLMQGLRLSVDPTPLCQWLYREGLIANVAGNNVLRLLPPYVVTEDQISRAVALIRKGLNHVATIPTIPTTPTTPNGVEV